MHVILNLMWQRLIPRIALLLTLACVGSAPAQAEDFRFPAASRIVVVGDVHGAYNELVAILRETGVVNADLHWQGGTTQLVTLGDLLDRGPGGRQALDLLMRLEGEARSAGGEYHALLGNHEVMNLVGDLRYVSKEDYAAYAGPDDTRLHQQAWQQFHDQQPAVSAQDFESHFPPGYFARAQAFAPEGRYGAWLLGKPFVIVIGDNAFTHGGLPPLVAQRGLEATNQQLREELRGYLQSWSDLRSELKLSAPVEFLDRPAVVEPAVGAKRAKALTELQAQPLFDEEGPTWYRGQALCYPDTETENLTAALAKLSASRVLVGHTVTPNHHVLSRFDGRVLELDTGMLRDVYKGRTSALVFESGQWRVAYTDRPGERLPPETPPRAVGLRPEGMDDDALEAWMKDARVVGVEGLDTGVTKPQRVTLEKDGLQLRAVLKQLSDASGGISGEAAENISDRFEYELAAYRLDRLIGLNMIPVTVRRNVNGRDGILQFWVEKATSLATVRKEGRKTEGECALAPQYDLMNVFDVLVHNVDRNLGNGLLTPEGMLVLIDHTRAFRLFPGDPPLLARRKVVVPQSLAVRLAALNREILQKELKPLIDDAQIRALLTRRDRLLRLVPKP